MYNEEAIDFGSVSAAAESKFLEPGMYRLKFDKEGIVLFTPDGKTPYLSARLYSQDGGAINEKFFLTAKALPRLQYLHEALLDKKLDKKFTSFIQVGEYFKAVLSALTKSYPVVTAGKITPDGKFYSGLPYTGFIVKDESLFEEGPFDKDSDQYKRLVKVEKPNPMVAGTDSSILPEMGGPSMPVAGGPTPW